MPQLRRRRVLVTGGAGFVAANLVRALAAEGAEVHAAVAPWSNLRRLSDLDVNVHECDVCADDSLAALVEGVAPELVFSLAVSRSGDLARLVGTNVAAVARLVELAGARRARIVHLGSATEYGPSREPLREDDQPAPAEPYGASKAAGTLLCRALASSGRADVVVLRPFAVYGPWDREERFVPKALAAAAGGDELPLTVPGLRRDWVFVGDVVEACLRAASARDVAGEVLNVGTGRDSTPEEVAAIVGRVTGRVLRTTVGTEPRRAWDRERWVPDLSRIERVLQWQPQTDLTEGLRLTHEWLAAAREHASSR